MKKLCASAALGLMALSAQATLTSTTNGLVTTLTDNFNGGATQCAYISFVNGNCVAANLQNPDGYLQMAPGSLNTTASATFSHDYGPQATNVSVSFWYVTSPSYTAVFDFAGTSVALPSTGYNFTNPGANNPSTGQAFFSHTFQNVAAGLHSLTFSTGIGSSKALFVDDLDITVSPVPEPQSYAMLLAGLGVVGGALRRRRKVASPS